MIKFFISIMTFSMCFGAGNLQEQMMRLSKELQKELNFQSIAQMSKLKELSSTNTQQTSNRDVDDLIGNWKMVEENTDAYITVGQDQSIQDIICLLYTSDAADE